MLKHKNEPMKKTLLILTTTLLFFTSSLRAQNNAANQVYSDLQFMLMPSFNSIMMANFNLGIGLQRKNTLGFGVGFHLDAINLPDLTIVSHGYGFQYRYAVNGIILKPEIGFSQLSIETEDEFWWIDDYMIGYYFRQEVTIQFTKAMTVGMSAMIYPHNWGKLSLSENENRSLTYINFHFGFTIQSKNRKNSSEDLE